MMVREKNISADIPDWEREKPLRLWDPGRRLLRTIRMHSHYSNHRLFFLRFISKFYVLLHRFWSVCSGCEIHLNSRIDGGLLIPHPSGIVIHPEAVIGPNCLLFQQVTLGSGGKKSGVPVLAGHVDIGAGAKILGGVYIGRDAKIGANAVVLDDVPAGCTAVGIPAKILVPSSKKRDSST